MKLAKKLLALALAGALALTVLTGCSESLRGAFKRASGAASVKAYPGVTTQQLDDAIRAAKKVADAVQKTEGQSNENYRMAQEVAFWAAFDKKDVIYQEEGGTVSGTVYGIIISSYTPASASDAATQIINNMGGMSILICADKTIPYFGCITGEDARKGGVVDPCDLEDEDVYIVCSTERLPRYLGDEAGRRLVIMKLPNYDFSRIAGGSSGRS